MNIQEYLVEFEDTSEADANVYAKELRDSLLDSSDTLRVEIERKDSQAQDFGSTLVLALGAPAVVVVAKAIGDWLRLRNSASITIKTREGHIIVDKINSKDAAILAEELAKTLPIKNG